MSWVIITYIYIHIYIHIYRHIYTHIYIYIYIYTVYRNTIHIISIHRGFSYRGIQLTSKDGTSLLCRIRLPQVPNDVGSSNLKLEPLDLGNTRLHHPLMLDFGFYPLINNQHGLVMLMVWKILENIDGNINNKKKGILMVWKMLDMSAWSSRS